VLLALRHLSAKEVPGNVEREVQGWFDHYRRMMVRQVILIHCPDAQTAAHKGPNQADKRFHIKGWQAI
jgi:hypothetical protein